jgi:hypothetical protein
VVDDRAYLHVQRWQGECGAQAMAFIEPRCPTSSVTGMEGILKDSHASVEMKHSCDIIHAYLMSRIIALGESTKIVAK